VPDYVVDVTTKMLRSGTSGDTNMPRVLSREQIEQARDISRVFVPVPEWALPSDEDPNEVGVYVQAMSGADFNRLQDQMVKASKGTNGSIQNISPMNLPSFKERLVQTCCVDEDGVRIFSKDDVSLIATKHVGIIVRLVDAINRISGLTPDDTAVIVGNSETIQGEDSLID
jgi:hypothetical protein